MLTCSNNVYPDAMEVRVHFQPNPITKFGEFITEYKYWYHYVTKKLQVEVAELEFPKLELDMFVLLGLPS